MQKKSDIGVVLAKIIGGHETEGGRTKTGGHQTKDPT